VVCGIPKSRIITQKEIREAFTQRLEENRQMKTTPKIKAYMAARYKAKRDVYLKDRKNYREKFPEKVRSSKLKAAFGITSEQYQQMLVDQSGVCAICRKAETAIHPASKKIRALAVDHDHETSKVRALLCHRCNSILGYVKDSSLWLHAAATYLEKHSGLY